MGEQEPQAEQTPLETDKRFADLDQLQQEIARRLKDNQRFLQRFLQDDFEEEEEEEGEEDPGSDEDYEEL